MQERDGRTILTAAIGAKPWRERLATVQAEDPGFGLEFAEISPIHRAFAPMARHQAYDVAEMAIVTILQALSYGKPLIVLPVTLAARFQQRCLIRRADDPRPVAALAGGRIAVRAYSQTTGMWLRGILQNDYGITPDAVHWVTQEGAHLAEYHPPAWVGTAPVGTTLPDLLRAGRVDAAILGNDLPDDPAFAPVLPDPDQAARDWYARHRIVPINHMMVVRRDVAEARPEAIRALWRAIGRAKPAPAGIDPDGIDPDGIDMAPLGIANNRRAMETVIGYCIQQSLLPQPLDVDVVFAGARDLLGDLLPI